MDNELNSKYNYNLLDREFIKGFNIELYEKCDIDKLELIVNNFYDIPEIGTLRNLSNSSYAKLDKDSTLTVLRNMLVEKKKSNKVIYRFPIYNSNGRLFSKAPSSQNCNKKVRHTLYSEYYYDCDMVSAHNTICIWYCNQVGIACDKIEFYVNNRDDCLVELQSIYNIDRDSSKERILSLMNGGNPEFDPKIAPKWLIDFGNQITLILDIISTKNPTIVDKIKKKLKTNNINEYNIKGKVANTIYCEIENNLLLLMKHFITDVKGKRVGSLVFDGFFIEKGDMSIEDCEEILAETEEYVRNESGFPIKLVVKEMLNGIDLTPYIKETIKCEPTIKEKKRAEPNPLYMDLKDRPVCGEMDLFDFNDWNMTVNKITSILDLYELFINTVQEIQDACDKNHFVTTTKRYNKMFDAYHEHIKTHNYNLMGVNSPLNKPTIIKNDKSLMKFWGKVYSEADEYIKIPIMMILRDLYSDGMLKVYNNYKFAPYPYNAIETDNSKYKDFNLFRGFKTAIDNPYLDDIELATTNFENGLMYKHIRMVLCNNEEPVYTYVLKSIAHIIQYPEDLPGVIIIFISVQGVGKDLFFKFLSYLIGVEYCLGFDNYANFFKDFNGERERILITCLNEINDGGTSRDTSSMFKNHNILKGAITGEKVRIEKKCKEADRVDHYSRYFAFSQFANCAYIEASDRRNMMIQCSNKYANDPKYFIPLVDYINDVDNIKVAFAYFSQMDLTTFSPRVFPSTELRKKQQENCISSSLQFIKSLWLTYEVPDEFRIQNDELYHLYILYCKKNHLQETSAKTFFKQIDEFGFNKDDVNTVKISGFIYNVKNDSVIMKVLRDTLFQTHNKKRVGYEINIKTIENMFKENFRRNEFTIEKIEK